MAIVQAIDLEKRYQMGSEWVVALSEVNVSVEKGEYVAIMGPSGSGKSTFLNLLGCLDKPTKGQYILGEDDVSTLSDNDLSEIRCKRIGFIFQSFNLGPDQRSSPYWTHFTRKKKPSS